MTALQNIKRIINTFGSFSVADLEGDSSPIVNSIGDTVVLAERFYANGVDVITYVNDTETDEDYVAYTELSEDVIGEINMLAETHEAICLKTEKRISN
jgi:hypothetical protein